MGRSERTKIRGKPAHGEQVRIQRAPECARRHVAPVPIYPDPYADEGEHEFTYALYPHPGDWRSGTVREAQALNVPLRPVFTSSVPGSAASAEWRLSNGTLELACLKRAEDSGSLILRLYEPHGNRGVATLKVGQAIRAAFIVNILEETLVSLPTTSDSRLEIEFRPFQVLTLRIELK